MHSGIVSYIAIVVASVVCMAGLGAAVMCYDCTSLSNGTCSFPFNGTGINTKNCSQCITYRIGILTNTSFTGVYYRGCYTVGYSNGCTGIGSAVTCSMVCATDYCNNQNAGNAGPTPVGVFIFSVLLLFSTATIKALAY